MDPSEAEQDMHKTWAPQVENSAAAYTGGQEAIAPSELWECFVVQGLGHNKDQDNPVPTGPTSPDDLVEDQPNESLSTPPPHHDYFMPHPKPLPAQSGEMAPMHGESFSDGRGSNDNDDDFNVLLDEISAIPEADANCAMAPQDATSSRATPCPAIASTSEACCRPPTEMPRSEVLVAMDCLQLEDRADDGRLRGDLLQMAVNQTGISEGENDQEAIPQTSEVEEVQILQRPDPSTEHQGQAMYPYPIFRKTARIALAVFDSPVQGPLLLMPSISPITGEQILSVVEPQEMPERMASRPEGPAPSYTFKIDSDIRGSMKGNSEDLQYEIVHNRPVRLQIGVEGTPGAVVEGNVTVHVVFSQADMAMKPAVPTKDKKVEAIAKAYPMFAGDPESRKRHVVFAGTKTKALVTYFQDHNIRKASLTLTAADGNTIFLVFPHLTFDVGKYKMWDLVVEIEDKKQKIPIQIVSVLRKPGKKRKRQIQDYYPTKDQCQNKNFFQSLGKT